MLDSIAAAELLQWQALYHESPWGSDSDDWRTALVMSAFNGEPPDRNKPQWGEPSGPTMVEISFDQACIAFQR